MDNINQRVKIDCQMTDNLNYSMQQNYVPLFRNIIITNATDEEIKDVTLTVAFEPAFATAYETSIEKLPPHQAIEISPVRIVISPEFMLSLTDKMLANVQIQVKNGEEVFSQLDLQTNLLSYDQWLGNSFMPEMISAFVTPNHPMISSLVSKASVYLNQWTGTPSFTGYQSQNPNVVKQQIGAVYAAVQAENIAYIMSPASYEEIGQRVRLPSDVLTQKKGNCLELTVLFASCLEAVGLNPLIVFIKGHAFAGCWLENDTFSESTTDDVSDLTKRIAYGIDCLTVFECTDVVTGRNIDFQIAEKHARDNLSEPEKFENAVDVIRSRGSGIRTMPSRVMQEGKYEFVDYGERKKSEITSAPGEINMELHAASAEAKEVTKQEIWERKLLDLSLRNSLLNFRPTATSVQLMTADLGVLEDELSKGESFKICPEPSDMMLKISDSKIYEIENDKNMIASIAEAEFKSKRLRTFVDEAELEKTLKKLHRLSKVSIEENGANTLYIALGFLRWFETEQSQRCRYAPLVLVPVDIIKKVQEKSYSIRIRDEEIQMNITLLEMLRQFYGINISGLNPLPCDESGVNLPLVFNTVRQGIMAKKHWDIDEYAFVGQFSFSQFIMWNDIRNRSEELRQNKVVASLISGKMEWTPEKITLTTQDIDSKISPVDMAIPTSTDSSQLAAIYEASNGQSFVLHGPPGTGKSQTITNMIANALYHKKSVLFVAEKMAALSVVEKRLSAIGLGPFCLELHSNKAQKRAVLQQLEQTLSVGHFKSVEEYEKAADKLHELRTQLNVVMEQIHKKRDYGMSVYNAIVLYEKNSINEGKIVFDNAVVAGMNSETYRLWNETVSKLVTVGNECGGYASSPFKNYKNRDYSIEIRDEFCKLANELSQTVKACGEDFSAVNSLFSSGVNPSFDNASSLAEIARQIMSSDYVMPAVISDETFEIRKPLLEKTIADGKRMAELFTLLSEKFEPEVWSYDCENASMQWKMKEQQWFVPKLFGQKNLVKELAVFAKSGTSVTKENIEEYYAQLCEHKRLADSIKSVDANISADFASLWLGVDTDWSLLEKTLNCCCEIRCVVASLNIEKIQRLAVAQAAISLIADKSAKSSASALLIKAGENFAHLENILQKLRDDFCVDTTALIGNDDCFAGIKSEADGWTASIGGLKDWTMLVCAVYELEQCGLSNVTEAYRNGAVTEGNIVSAFDCGIARAMVMETIRDIPELSAFQGAKFEAVIAKYNEMTSLFEEITIKELAARLSSKIPDSSSGAAGSSEIGILQRAIKSGGRMMPIRKLFDSIPNLLRRICPCMLMSPISVAQYIDPSFPKFDLVIFDEASQLPTCEAVGAIARGENVVVVGDPKQLPPTSFFSANHFDEDNCDKEDLESVLDDCLAISMPQKHLLWHYRSRHESLIAYSNARYYDNRLLTFPSPDDLVSEVRWINVEGYYDKGGTKQNKAEAQAIIEEIVHRLSDETLRKDSIGVVTFSSVQQILIDDMLADEFRKNPQLEAWADEMYEPILVKNLENVQGDERDIIMFSVGYGPDKNGNVSMNFGPLNRDGGWRRLNVAISRARKEMLVYSVIKPEQIDLSKTRSDGVEGLKGFLEFAARGRNSLVVRSDTIVSDESEFEKLVAEKLNEMGYEVKCNIGCSGYKIDIGVVNPDDKGAYVLGIMCDGKKHLDGSTARDRNILQPKVLAGLGWKIKNVWILDWLDNEEKVLAKLKKAIDDSINEYRTEPQKEIRPAAQPVRELKFESAKIESAGDKCGQYTEFAVIVIGTPEQYADIKTKKQIMKLITQIVEVEAPVSRKSVYKKVLSAWGITRGGSKTERIFDEAVKDAGVVTAESNKSIFFWKKTQSPEAYFECRIPTTDGVKRNMDDISAEEIANGIQLLLSNQISMLRQDIIRETAKLFGFSRTGGTIEVAVSRGIACANRRGNLSISDDGLRISLKEEV